MFFELNPYDKYLKVYRLTKSYNQRIQNISDFFDEHNSNIAEYKDDESVIRYLEQEYDYTICELKKQYKNSNVLFFIEMKLLE